MNSLSQKIRRVFNQLGNKMYLYSQNNVPVKSGKLKQSGKLNILGKSFEISYGNKDVPYAATVEFGIERNIPIIGTQITRDGKRYVNKRVIYIEGVGFRVIHEIKARPGRFFLVNAVEKAIKEFREDLARELGGKIV